MNIITWHTFLKSYLPSVKLNFTFLIVLTVIVLSWFWVPSLDMLQLLVVLVHMTAWWKPQPKFQVCAEHPDNTTSIHLALIAQHASLTLGEASPGKWLAEYKLRPTRKTLLPPIIYSFWYPNPDFNDLLIYYFSINKANQNWASEI